MKCSACQSEVKADDNYCSHCGNILKKTAASETSMPSIVSVYSFPERLVKPLRIPYWLGYIIFWELILSMDYIAAHTYTPDKEMLPLMAAQKGFFILICASIIYCSKQLEKFFPSLCSFIDMPIPQLKEWYDRRLKQAYESKASLLFALAFTSMVTFSIYPFVKFACGDSEILLWIRLISSFIGFFFAGLGIWAIIVIIRFANEIAGFKVKIAVFQNRQTGILSMGSLFLRMSFSIALANSMIVLTAVFSPFGNSWIILFWLGIAVLSVLAFFIIPQYGVHKIMAKEKEQRIEAFAGHLETAMEESLRNPDQDNMQRLRQLFELQNHLNQMNEWPFNYNALWQLITALLIPILLAAVDIMWK
ncbi:MAG: hypothetical protein ACJ75J_08460 [Cytophagaceae bacterium]